jgi:hypothetical protein
MIKELTEKLIRDTFAKTGIDTKYYPQYEAEVKRRYASLQKDDPDYEDTPEDESNAICSLELTDEYIAIYVEEIEKGHCPQWSDVYAKNSVLGESEYWIARLAYDAVGEVDKGKELEIHAQSINEDSVFIERYRYLFKEGDCDAREMAEDYCHAYHQCIEEGKSEVYSRAYAEMVNEGYYEEFCEIHAEAYELAIKHGMNEDDAYMFGYFCTELADRNLLLRLNEFSRKYKEDWQRDFYLHLILDDYEKVNKTRMTDSQIADVKKELYR